MLTLVIERTRSFDRRIAIRNAVECCAGFFMAILFSWFAWKSPTVTERVGMAIVAASGPWIAFYLLRYGRGPGKLDRAVSINSYRQLLAESYDSQIKLLRTVKYWYLLPPYLGLVIASLGQWLRLRHSGAAPWPAWIVLGTVSLTFAFVWALNEIWGVHYLEKLKRELPAAVE